MDILKRKFRGEKRVFRIYPQAEADEVGLEYVHWKEAQVGDWALSDDGYVGECLDIKGPYTNYAGSKAVFMIFSYGKVFNYPNTKLNYLERKATNSYSRISTKDWVTIEAQIKRGKRFINAYVMNFMAGVPIDWEKLGLLYRADEKEPAKKAKYLFNQEVFKKMIQQKMIEVFKGEGKTESDVIKMLDKSFEMAEGNKDPKEMRLVAEDFIELFDMKPKELPLGREIPYDESNVRDELQDDIGKAQLELGQKKIEAGADNQGKTLQDRADLRELTGTKEDS